MGLKERAIWVALGAAALGGLLFGMMLGVLSPGGGDDSGPTFGATTPSTGTTTDPGPTADDTSTGTPSEECEDRPANDFGFVNDVTDEDGQTVLVFDRAQLFTGAEATAEAQRRGNQIDTDYYVANDNRRERERAVSQTATATGSGLLTNSPGPIEVPLTTVYEFVRAHPGQLLVYLTYDEQTCDIAKIEEAYFP